MVQLKKYIIPILFIIIVILIGYYQLFFGANLFIYGDQFVNSGWTYGNSLGNGWRPEIGFGISFFFADPGAWHPWGIWSLWENIVHSRRLAYHCSVVFLGIVSAIAIYLFLRRVAPGLGISACLLAPLVIFSMGQDCFHFNRIPITIFFGSSLLLVLLYDFYKRPKLIHFFYIIILFWYVIFFGSYLCFTTLPSLGLVFTITYCIYYKESWKKIFSRCLLILFVGGVGTILLGFWVFYPISVEAHLVGYFREKLYSYPLGLIPNIKALGQYFLNLFQFYSIPTNIFFLGLGARPFYYSFNVIAFFPLIFIYFLYRRASTFWEFSLKWLVAVFYISQGLILFPVFSSILSYICNTTKLFGFYGGSWVAFIRPLQIGLIAIFFNEIKKNDYEIKQLCGRRIQLAIAWLLFIFYAGLTFFSIFALFMPEVLPRVISSVVEHFCPEQIGPYTKELIAYGAVINTDVLQAAMKWHSLIFYLLTTLFIFSFIWNRRLFPLIGKRITPLLGIILFTAILYSWTVYPLNKIPPVWEEIASELPEFSPTDRFYYVSTEQWPLESEELKRRLEGLKQRIRGSGGPSNYLRLRADHFESPGLRLHGVKSFTQKNVADFMFHIFNGDGIKRVHQIRQLYTGGPLISSELLDMGAVSYYFSRKELKDIPENLSPYVKTKLINIYKNNSAWPYFYLAKRMEIAKEGEHLTNVERGIAYVNEKDYFRLSGYPDNSKIRLKEFKYGRLTFDYKGDEENFLVVADAWHPFWRASIGDKGLSVVKANEIFKGVRLPPGEYTLSLFFDTSAYFLGIYVSATLWFLFLVGWILTLTLTSNSARHRLSGCGP